MDLEKLRDFGQLKLQEVYGTDVLNPNMGMCALVCTGRSVAIQVRGVIPPQPRLSTFGATSGIMCSHVGMPFLEEWGGTGAGP